MGKLITIGEFGRRSGLSVSALRFYDSVGLLVPAEVDTRTGYRHYDEGSLAEAELVRDLRRLEMRIATISSFLGAEAEVRSKILSEHVEGLSARVRHLEEIARRVFHTISEEDDSMTTMTVDGSELCQSLDQVLPAAGTDPERPTLLTVLIEAREGSLRLVATDSYRLAVRDLVARAGTQASFRTLVAAAALARVRPGLEGAATVELHQEGSKLVLATPKGTIEISEVPAEFPDYERLFGSDPAASVLTVERALQATTLEAATEEVLRLELGPFGARVGAEPGALVPGHYQGQLMTLGINREFALYAVAAGLGPELLLEVTSPLEPIVFRSATDASYICLVMPFRLD
jgi:DNA polymerase-3 subunit beta